MLKQVHLSFAQLEMYPTPPFTANRDLVMSAPHVIIGILAGVFCYLLPMETGRSGIEYYREAHLSTFNSLVHTIFMPFTAFGALVIIPNVLILLIPSLNSDTYIWRIQSGIYTAYLTHYFFISIPVTLCISIIYGIVLVEAYIKRMKILNACIIMLGALIIQEVIGHWIGGDIPSRIEGVPNAIIYAVMFSIDHLRHFILPPPVENLVLAPQQHQE